VAATAAGRFIPFATTASSARSTATTTAWTATKFLITPAIKFSTTATAAAMLLVLAGVIAATLLVTAMLLRGR
jgi:hypothetical protein